MFQGGLFVRACCLKDSFREKRSTRAHQQLNSHIEATPYRSVSDPVVVFVGLWPAFDCSPTRVGGQQGAPRAGSGVGH